MYEPEADFMVIFLERDRQELRERIAARVFEMFNQGWIEETQALENTAWQEFIQRKNLIGYNEIFEYLLTQKTQEDFKSMAHKINIQTRQYAKRQHTFWRKLEREINKEKRYTGKYVGCLETVNLTNLKIHLYINELLKRLYCKIGKKYE